MISLVEAWKPLLSHWILDNIYDQLIMPKLIKEVNNWNPLTDTMPIHLWIHPWIPLLGKSLYSFTCEMVSTSFNSYLKVIP